MRKHDFSFGAGDEEENEINLTPMLDVVFIMLIFFIVTASFIKEAGIDVNRPDAPVTETKPEDANILVAITADDQIFIDRRLIDPRAVRANIERLHAENPEGSVVIQASTPMTGPSKYSIRPERTCLLCCRWCTRKDSGGGSVAAMARWAATTKSWALAKKREPSKRKINKPG